MENYKVTAPVVQPLGVSWLPEPFVDRSNEETDNEVIYGWAPLGVDESDTQWRLMKEVTESGVTKRLYPNGSMDFAFAWTERTNYEYGR